MNITQIWLQFQNRLICPERIQSVDEPPSVMVSSGGLEIALIYAGRLMCFL